MFTGHSPWTLHIDLNFRTETMGIRSCTSTNSLQAFGSMCEGWAGASWHDSVPKIHILIIHKRRVCFFLGHSSIISYQKSPLSIFPQFSLNLRRFLFFKLPLLLLPIDYPAQLGLFKFHPSIHIYITRYYAC